MAAVVLIASVPQAIAPASCVGRPAPRCGTSADSRFRCRKQACGTALRELLPLVRSSRCPDVDTEALASGRMRASRPLPAPSQAQMPPPWRSRASAQRIVPWAATPTVDTGTPPRDSRLSVGRRSRRRSSVGGEGSNMSRSRLARIGAIAVVAFSASGGVAGADANNNNSPKLRAAKSGAAGILEHERGLRSVSRTRRGGTLAGTTGLRRLGAIRGEQSHRCRLERLVPRFRVTTWTSWPISRPPVLAVVSGGLGAGVRAGHRRWVAGGRLRLDVQLAARPTSRDRFPPSTSTSTLVAAVNTQHQRLVSPPTTTECPPGGIALVQRGTCTFAQEVQAVELAPAPAA